MAAWKLHSVECSLDGFLPLIGIAQKEKEGGGIRGRQLTQPNVNNGKGERVGAKREGRESGRKKQQRLAERREPFSRVLNKAAIDAGQQKIQS